MHTQGVRAFRFRTPEQRVKVVDFDVALGIKIEVTMIICAQNAFIWCKDCENWSGRSEILV